MTNKKDIIIAVLATFCLASALFMILPSRSSPYDAWKDINGDGIIDMKDIGYTVQSYGTSGDSTKFVNVTNWPTYDDATVWFQTSLNNTWITSPSYNAYGFGHMHILVSVSCLAQDANATVYLYSTMWNANHTNWRSVNAWSIQFTGSGSLRSVATTIPVPGEEFYFLAATTPVLNNAFLYLSFYLTWS